jgi:triosephosphate isomerase (TIM)
VRSRRRRALVLGNWKMHMTAHAAGRKAGEFARRAQAARDREIAVAPPFTALVAVAEAVRGTPVLLAAQNLFWEDEGPYTGEVSAPMLAEIGVTYVLVGHSERRLWLGETDRMVHRKIAAALRSSLRPVLCVGEDEKARDAGLAGQVVRDQLLLALEGVARKETARLAVAYEPIWAVGTGHAASPADAAEMHALVRAELEALFGDAADAVRILYGGSVTERNIDALMARPEIDGVLVGGAALRPGEFARIAGFEAAG